MKSPQWTLLVIRDDLNSMRQVRVTGPAVRLVVGVAFIAFSVLVTLCAQVVSRVHGPQQNARLARENVELKSELDEIREQMGLLSETVADLTQRDEQIRLIAGLEPLDASVHAAGIGGQDSGAGLFSTSLELNTLLRRARLLTASWTEASDSLTMKYEQLASTPSILPTEGSISSAFSRWRFHPILNRPRAHEGVDIAAMRGTPIVASAKGRVAFVGYNGEYGQMVEIDHGFGYVTRYAHASRLLVQRGQLVKRGDRIAEVGETGLAVGPHLHYEVLVNGKPVNPRSYVFHFDAIPD